MEDKDLNELRAYKTGYDLGWYRAIETVVPLLEEIENCMEKSATWKKIEAENEKPLFVANMLDAILQLRTIQSEHLPAIALQQKAINDMGQRLLSLGDDGWKKLGQEDHSSLVIDKGEEDGKRLSPNV